MIIYQDEIIIIPPEYVQEFIIILEQGLKVCNKTTTYKFRLLLRQWIKEEKAWLKKDKQEND